MVEYDNVLVLEYVLDVRQRGAAALRPPPAGRLDAIALMEGLPTAARRR
eukprot:COSAG03_NODE_7594_length_896_cov_0.977415_1_plen_48_part_10